MSTTPTTDAEWSSDMPQTAGDYLFKCGETKYSKELKLVFSSGGELWVQCFDIGDRPLADYHNNLENPQWKPITLYPSETDEERIERLERENAALKAELEQAKADRARAAMEERNKCLATMERQKEALMVALKSLGECQAMVRNEIMVREMLDESANAWPDLLNGCVSGGGIESALAAINEALGRGNLEAEPEALPDTHADRLPEQRAPDGDSSDPAGKA